LYTTHYEIQNGLLLTSGIKSRGTWTLPENGRQLIAVPSPGPGD
jgi:hypothetical protein